MNVRRSCLWLATALLVGGCAFLRELGVGVDDPEWVESEFEGVNRGDLVQLVATVIGREFQIQREDPYRGEVESAWLTGDYERHTHQLLRVRALAHVDRTDEGPLRVRLRVQREIHSKPGLLRQPAEEDWEVHTDDVLRAQILMQHVRSLLYGMEEGESVDEN